MLGHLPRSIHPQSLPSFLVQDELRRGELVEPFPDRTLAGDLGYYLAYPAWNRELPALKAFRAWIGDTLG